MTTPAQPPDQHFLDLVRAGDISAYSVLFERHYRDGVRIAASFVSPGMAEELTSEAFSKILEQLRTGRGPREAFRAYLIATVRNLNVDHLRRVQRTRPVEDVATWAPSGSTVDPTDARLVSTEATQAFATLPERWQKVLWLHCVEGRPLAEVAEILGITPNSAAQLGFRAREALRIAYLALQVPPVPAPECRTVAATLPRYVRGAGDQRRVHAHLVGCTSCSETSVRLAAVSRTFPGAGSRAR